MMCFYIDLYITFKAKLEETFTDLMCYAAMSEDSGYSNNQGWIPVSPMHGLDMDI